ncbi:MAG: sigma 54-interacting transcriptional regulator [Polyangiaceae bacterium]
MPRPKDDYPSHPHPYPNDGAFSLPVDLELSKLAPSRATVLVIGGAPELRQAAAIALHQRSPRRSSPFVAFHCRAHPSSDVGRELFGGPPHEASLVGGAVERARSGTLYLADIDALPAVEQPRFLRFLDQERAARVVVSSAVELSGQVSLGKLRLDLAERLMAIELLLADDGTNA